MLLSHSSKKCCIDADINYLGKAGKPFPTGIQMSFIIWFSHLRKTEHPTDCLCSPGDGVTESGKCAKPV